MSYYYKGISNNPEERQQVIYPYCYWNNCFTNSELDTISELALLTSTKEASISAEDDISDQKPPKSVIKDEIRRSKVSFITPNENNEWIFFRFNQIIESVNNKWYNFDLNGYDQIQYTEYHSSNLGHYYWHTDIFLGKLPENNYTETRKLSLSLLLNSPDEFEGGELHIGHESNYESVKMDRGTAILFPSWQLHRVSPVTKGIRKSLVIWVLGPKFK
jgi:PKHD-type hydroxylase